MNAFFFTSRNGNSCLTVQLRPGTIYGEKNLVLTCENSGETKEKKTLGEQAAICEKGERGKGK